jgi:hypothetical protein
MRRRLLTVVILIALGSTSCTTIGPAYTPHPEVQSDQSLVYIYRPQVHALSGMTAVFTLDEVPVAKLENNGYVALLTKPGAHKLRHSWKAGLLADTKLESQTIEATVTLAPGSTSYIQLSSVASSQYQSSGTSYVAGTMHTNWRWGLRQVAETVAVEELKQCRLGELIAMQR